MRATLETAKTRPILFSGPMVLALLDGTKTQTRRVMKPQPAPDREAILARFPKQDGCPYGKPGDRLWVRETWRVFGGREYEYQQEPRAVIYRASAEAVDFLQAEWRPSIFMPRWACRMVLEVTSARVERLQAISEADAEAEGCFALGDSECTARRQYEILWDKINGKGAWGKNPWVWVIEFKRAEEMRRAA